MFQIASRYRKEIKFWELWNEPDLDQWQGPPAEFAALLKEGAAQVRRANPEARVILAGMARGPGELFTDLLARQGVGPLFDAFAFHTYAESWGKERMEDVFPYWPEAMAGLIARHHHVRSPEALTAEENRMNRGVALTVVALTALAVAARGCADPTGRSRLAS
jgi:hypothetical protein